MISFTELAKLFGQALLISAAFFVFMVLLGVAFG